MPLATPPITWDVDFERGMDIVAVRLGVMVSGIG